jgi:hypothetical protein
MALMMLKTAFLLIVEHALWPLRMAQNRFSHGQKGKMGVTMTGLVFTLGRCTSYAAMLH